jgi:poly-beta-1,6-N-acetyl-D-glucosamine biosynthesis protein PgaD
MVYLKSKKTSVHIIDKPWALNRTRRYSERMFTIVFWWLWAFWLRPVIVLILWALGIRMVFIEIIKTKFGLEIGILLMYVFLVSTIYILLQSWNRYNYLRFRNRERRKAKKDVEDAEIAEHYRLKESEVAKLKNMDFLEIDILSGDIIFNDSGKKREILYSKEKSGPGG